MPCARGSVHFRSCLLRTASSLGRHSDAVGIAVDKVWIIKFWATLSRTWTDRVCVPFCHGICGGTSGLCCPEHGLTEVCATVSHGTWGRCGSLFSDRTVCNIAAATWRPTSAVQVIHMILHASSASHGAKFQFSVLQTVSYPQLLLAADTYIVPLTLNFN